MDDAKIDTHHACGCRDLDNSVIAEVVHQIAASKAQLDHLVHDCTEEGEEGGRGGDHDRAAEEFPAEKLILAARVLRNACAGSISNCEAIIAQENAVEMVQCTELGCLMSHGSQDAALHRGLLHCRCSTT